jgi:hypothetical protein
MMDTNVQAHANLKGNSRAISVETEDEGDPVGVPWTFAQLDALVKLVAWVSVEHGIPPVLMGEWTEPGIGYHAMWGFVDPIAQVGRIRSPWTNSSGKTCPGRTRIRQLLEIVLPELQEAIGVQRTSLGTNEGGDIMAMQLTDWHKAIADATGNEYSAAVELWQRLLNAEGASLVADGLVGQATEAAHKAWARSVGSGQITARPGRFQWRRLINEIAVQFDDAELLAERERELERAESKIADAIEVLS